jgi:membrane-bound serine protease (ClpP class)
MVSPRRPVRFLVGLLFPILASIWALAPAQETQGSPPRAVYLIEIRDAIGPATSAFFLKSLATAEESGAQLLVVQLDTPGGLESAMRDMIRAILASSIPVAIYVSPSGARAASAGTYLLYASHIAAMAPATNLGAATPVQLGGGAPLPGRPQDDPVTREPGAPAGPGAGPADPASAMERKVVNDSVAYIRGLAELRGRNADWAESAVRSGVSLPASSAREQNVIDLIASDVPDLLKQIDGRTIRTQTGTVQLATTHATVERIDADWRIRLLATLTNPNVAYILLLVGVYGLLLEAFNPGTLVPGIAGAICLLVALYALQVLSVNYAGLGLMVLGLALIASEAFVPSFGALGIGGIASFVIGSIMLLDKDVPGFRVATGLIGGVAFGGGAIMLATVVFFARSRRQPVVTGVERMLKETAVALGDFEESGPVLVVGERWTAVSRTPVRKGQRLKVLRVDGLKLEVAPEE